MSIYLFTQIRFECFLVHGRYNLLIYTFTTQRMEVNLKDTFLLQGCKVYHKTGDSNALISAGNTITKLHLLNDVSGFNTSQMVQIKNLEHPKMWWGSRPLP